MDVVGVMAAYLPVVCVCVCLCVPHNVQYTQANTDYVHIKGLDRTITVILTKHYIELPDDGSVVIRNMLGQF